MSRSVNEVEDILLAIVHILHLDSVALDCNSALLLKVHVVKHLPFGDVDCLGCLQQTVGQCRLTVVYVGNDAKVSDSFHIL